MHPLEENRLPALDQITYPATQTATLAMGCFWGPEALFGAMPGVIRTRVGFAGGSTENPTYRTIADHLETVQLDFDPDQVTYAQLLEQFFAHHTPTKEPRKRQYTSAIFYHSPEQEQLARKAIKTAEERLQQKIMTEVLAYEQFYLAEERHQKWKLRRVPAVLNELQKIYPQEEAFNNSTAVARVNGYVGGHGEKERFMEEMGSLGLSYPIQQTLLAHFLAQELGDFPFKA
ncbi:peptide-methionine (S)-S-oxide reductase MsrA [Rufibacter sediminis]|uniref:Peptide methionine sulfoxide reductase MsrA n=1 Tax=Rufibacter sediminis TaxID=2762756 RepID=A0ABR6VYL9_9BACT|nr:peptide-methionine (S)-S-oxide reductase MsrA [Rufibacter sediminis]MBC3542188.1 peptide-methionine (S)-S-oxide reductase MsrA [Rufibacter sediminis]